MEGGREEEVDVDRGGKGNLVETTDRVGRKWAQESEQGQRTKVKKTLSMIDLVPNNLANQ